MKRSDLLYLLFLCTLSSVFFLGATYFKQSGLVIRPTETTTAETTLQLVATSDQAHIFDGSTFHTAKFPNATTLPNGWFYYVSNQSATRNITVLDFDDNNIGDIRPTETYQYLLSDNSSTAGTWRIFRGSSAQGISDGQNIGGGEGIYAQKLNNFLQLKSLVAGTNVTLSSDATEITITASGVGESNTASNQGAGGVGPFIQKTGVDLEFKNINVGSNQISVTDDAGNNEIDVDLVPGNVDLATLGGSLDLTSQVTGLLPPVNGGTGQDFSGSTGVIKVGSGNFSAGTVTDSDVAATADITRTKLAAGSANHVLINDGSGEVSSEAALDETRGGTAQTTYTTGDILYSSAADTLSKLAIGSADQVLTVSGGLPSWQDAGAGTAATDNVVFVGTDETLDLATQDVVIVDTSSANRTVTLPLGAKGDKIIIKKDTSDINSVIVAPDPSDTIDDKDQYLIRKMYGSVTFIHDGNLNWRTSSQFESPRLEWLRVSASCSSSPCTIANRSSTAISSVTRSAQGNYALNFASNIWSDPPSCAGTAKSPGVTIFADSAGTSTTVYDFSIGDSNLNRVDTGFVILCVGYREQ